MPATLAPAWKNEVARRIAEHRSRKGSLADLPQLPFDPPPPSSRRAAEAVARVAARYANAPSYGDVLADEARAALRAAQAASRAAMVAQAAAQQVLAGLELVSDAVSLSDPLPALSEPALEGQSHQSQAYAIQWQPDLPPLPAYPPAAHEARDVDPFSLRIAEWQDAAALTQPDQGDLEVVEPAQPIHANLIQFPRELVATRKLRPRLSAEPYPAAAPGTQLSIFEVDPATVSTEPAANAAPPAPSYTEPDWTRIVLDAQPNTDYGYDIDQAPDLAPFESEAESAADRAAEPAFVLASVHRRLLAALVDSALIAGALLIVAMLTLSFSSVLPQLCDLEVGRCWVSPSPAPFTRCSSSPCPQPRRE